MCVCVFLSFPWLTLSLTRGKARAHTRSPSFIMVVVHGCQTYWIFNNIRIDWAVLAEPRSQIDTMTTYPEIKVPWGRFAINSQIFAEWPVAGPNGADRPGKGSLLSLGCSHWVLWCMDVSLQGAAALTFHRTCRRWAEFCFSRFWVSVKASHLPNSAPETPCYQQLMREEPVINSSIVHQEQNGSICPCAHGPALTLCVGKPLCCDFPLDQHPEEGEDRPHPQDDPGEPAHWLLWCHLQVKHRGRYLGNDFISYTQILAKANMNPWWWW